MMLASGTRFLEEGRKIALLQSLLLQAKTTLIAEEAWLLVPAMWCQRDTTTILYIPAAAIDAISL